MKLLNAAAAVYKNQQSDQMSLTSAASSRRPNRLSTLASRRSNFSSKTAQESETYSLHPAPSNHSSQSINSANSSSSGYVGHYKLSRVESQQTVESGLAVESRYKVTLELSPKEISLLRYMWNKMLGEEPAFSEESSNLPLPGSLWAQAKEKPLPNISQPRQAFGASSTFCSQLYSNLLTMAPGLEIAFPSLRHQAVAMAGVLSLAVNSLENLSNLDGYLTQLGNRHARILGIEPAQFELMGEAFIQTFHERFGTRFTHELEVLWIKFYMYLANSLLQFGLDPVMRVGQEREGNVALSTESIYTTETDANSMGNSARRTSTSTDFSSVASVKTHTGSSKGKVARNGHGASSANASKSGNTYHGILAQTAQAVAPSSQPPLAKKKRGRLGRAKDECTIV